MARRTGANVSVDADGNKTTERYYLSLRQELTRDVAEAWIRWSLDSLQGSYPTDIDDFRARFNPDDMFREYLLANGVTLAEIAAIPVPIRLAFKLCGTMALSAALWVHGKIPGQSSEESDYQEPIP